MPAPKAISTEVQAQARRLYEETDVPVRDIAKLMGIGDNTFYRRLRGWHWQMRKERTSPLERSALAFQGPAQIKELIETQVGESPPTAPSSGGFQVEVLAARVQRAVEDQIVAVERLMQAYDSASTRAGQAERAARTLASLSQTLTALRKMNEKNDNSPESADDRSVRDVDDIRRELSETLERIVAEQRAEAGGKRQP